MARSVLLAVVFWAAQSGPAWMRLDLARAASALTGKPVLLYVAVDPKTGDFT
jgi:hypothetical protein